MTSIDTVNDLPRRVQYTAAPAQTEFDYTFPIFVKGDLVVDVDGTVLAVDVGYTVAGMGDDAGGTITLTTPAVGSEVVTIYSDIAYERDTDVSQDGPWDSSAYNDELDKFMLLMQQLRDAFKRCLRIPVTAAVDDADIEFTPISNWASKFLSFDADGKPTPASLSDTALTQEVVGSHLYEYNAALDGGLTPAAGMYHYPYGHIKRYGVKGDSATDDQAKLNLISAASWTQYTRIKGETGMNCLITDTVTWDNHYLIVDLPDVTFTYTGTPDRVALVVGNATAAYAYRTMCMPSMITTGNTYAHDDFIGIQLQGNWQKCDVRFQYMTGFTTNIQFYANNNSGMLYNDFRVGGSWDAKYHVRISGISSIGSINENRWPGAQIRCSSSYDSSRVMYGVVFEHGVGGYTGSNKNDFDKWSFEITQGGVSAERIPIHFNNTGGSNTFRNARFEGLNGEICRITSDTVAVRNNTIDVGYAGTAAGTITAFITETDGGLSYGNKVLLNGLPLAHHYYSGNLVAKAWASAANTIEVQGMFFQSSASGTETRGGTGKIGKDYLIIHSTSIGTYVDTTYCKEFRLTSEIQDALGGRLVFTAYDGVGVQITTAGAVMFGGVQEDANYGGKRYYQSADNTGTLDFRVDSTVKALKIMWANGTLPCNLKSFTLTAYVTGAYPTVALTPTATNYGSGIYGGPWSPKQFTSLTDPTALGGHFTERGFFAGFQSAAAAAKMGFCCSLGGWGAKPWVLSTGYKKNEMATNDTGKVYYCSVAGTSAGSGGPTGTGSSEITDGTAKWYYVGSPTGLNATWTDAANAGAT